MKFWPFPNINVLRKLCSQNTFSSLTDLDMFYISVSIGAVSSAKHFNNRSDFDKESRSFHCSVYYTRLPVYECCDQSKNCFIPKTVGVDLHNNTLFLSTVLVRGSLLSLEIIHFDGNDDDVVILIYKLSYSQFPEISAN